MLSARDRLMPSATKRGSREKGRAIFAAICPLPVDGVRGTHRFFSDLTSWQMRGIAMSAETLQFKTELKQLLHIIVHSLYSHKDIFLRELISNASDAIDTARFQSLTNPAILEGDPEWKIR